jgi:AAA+ ATPase superfamily predicted ATPase
MNLSPFVGRGAELRELELLFKKKTASFVVIQGRRRIGKSRLIREFCKGKHFYIFSGIPVTPETTAQSQREEFARQITEQCKLPGLKGDDWGDLFTVLAKYVSRDKLVVILDEVSWLGSKDPDFLGKLKNAWDLYFSQNPRLMLIICGSVSSWIETNILSSTGFVGRISFSMTLKELSILESSQLLKLLGSYASSYEKFKLLSVTGGVPKYLEEVQPSLTAEENIKRLCFQSGGLLYREFDQIFSDLFSARSKIYKRVVRILANGVMDYNHIYKKLGLTKSGLLSEYLRDLIKAGFISRDYTWHIKSGEESRLSHYRLSDNYVRFYLKYIEPNRGKIERGLFQVQSLSQFPGWDVVMGYQFENLVLNNRDFIFEKLHLRHEDIVSDNPFFQRKTVRVPGCQIDYLIQTKFNALFVCEIKFSKHEVKPKIIDEMKTRINRFIRPKGYSYLPVLIHVNGVQESVVDSSYFTAIIDFSEFLDV